MLGLARLAAHTAGHLGRCGAHQGDRRNRIILLVLLGEQEAMEGGGGGLTSVRHGGVPRGTDPDGIHLIRPFPALVGSSGEWGDQGGRRVPTGERERG